MSVTIEPVTPVRPQDTPLAATLDRLWTELPRLQKIDVDVELGNRLVDHVAALRYLLHAEPNRPLLAGLVGGASCGKSTLFGSVVGRALSRIHYRPHSSLGPVLWLHRRHSNALLGESQSSRFLPQFTTHELAASTASTVGGVAELVLAAHDDDRWQHIALMDLPDISSESARREGWLVRRLLPWLDLVIWMVDPNDYLFEDLYIDLIEQASALGQRSIVVVNDIHGQIQGASAVLQDRIARFRPDAWFALPQLECRPNLPYPLFRQEPDFLRFKDFLGQFRRHRPMAPLVARVRQDSQVLIHSNSEWARVAAELSTGLHRLIARHRKRILASAPLLSVLPDLAQQELERLRNRFSIWHQSKRLYRAIRSPARTMSQAAFRQFQLSAEDLDSEPLYRHLIGTLKEFGVDLHREYLESRFVRQMQQRDSQYRVLGSFEPETLEFKEQLDVLARHVFAGAQQILSDPALLKDKRFHFVVGATGVALIFLAAESMLGMVGLTLLLGKGLTALTAVLSPELARYLPLDRIGRLAIEAREMLGTIIDQQMTKMLQFYTACPGCYLEAGDPLLELLKVVQLDKSGIA